MIDQGEGCGYEVMESAVKLRRKLLADCVVADVLDQLDAEPRCIARGVEVAPQISQISVEDPETATEAAPSVESHRPWVLPYLSQKVFDPLFALGAVRRRFGTGLLFHATSIANDGEDLVPISSELRHP